MDTNIAEKVERYNEVGQVVRVTLRWRGKIYYLQMFFPGSKFPSRGEVETQVKKIYPDSVVMVHYASETQPNQPLIRVTEERDEYGDPVGGPKISKKEKEKNLKKNEKDEDHTTTTAEGKELKYGNYGNYISGQTKDKTIKEKPMKKVDYTKLAASNELEGEQLDEMPSLAGAIKAIKPLTNKVKSFVKKGIENRQKQIDKSGKDGATSSYGQTLQMNSQEPEGEVIKENEKENPTFVQFMKRIDQLPEVTREAIKNCGNDPAIAKAALEISGIDK